MDAFEFLDKDKDATDTRVTLQYSCSQIDLIAA